MLIHLKGNDSYQAKKAITEIRQKYLTKNPDGLELIELDPDSPAPNWADLRAIPLFATSRLIIVKETAKLLKAAQEDLANFLGGLPETTVVLIWDGGDQSSEQLNSRLSKADKVISVAPLEGTALRRQITKVAKEQGLELDEPTIKQLIESYGDDLWALEQEIKILALGGSLSSRKVKNSKFDFVYFRLCRAQDWPGIQRQLSEDSASGRPIELTMGELAAAIRKEVRDPEHKLRLTDILMDLDIAIKTGLLDEPAATAMLISALPKSSRMLVEWEGVWQDLIS
jgi:hypothetical protein